MITQMITYLYNHRLVRFLFSGGMAVITNVGLLFLLVHVFHFYYLFSAIISYTMAIIVSFLLQKYFTFSDYDKERLSRQASYYLGFQIFNLGVNTLFMYVAVDFLHTQYIIAQSIIVVIMTIYNFFVYKYWIFK